MNYYFIINLHIWHNLMYEEGIYFVPFMYVSDSFTWHWLYLS
jgi:hypothetical protein